MQLEQAQLAQVDHKDPLEQLDLTVLQDHKAQLELLGQVAFKVKLVQLAQVAFKDHKDHKDHKAQLELPVQVD